MVRPGTHGTAILKHPGPVGPRGLEPRLEHGVPHLPSGEPCAIEVVHVPSSVEQARGIRPKRVEMVTDLAKQERA